MINDFQHACASRGRGKPRPSYKVARLEELFEKSIVKRKGVEAVMMDWFEFEAHYQSKKMDDTDIEKKWRAALEHGRADPDDMDMEGENPHFPERVAVATKTFRLKFDEEAIRQQAVRSSEVSKKADDDNWQKLKETLDPGPCEDHFPATPVKRRRFDGEVGPSPRSGTKAAAGQASGESPGGGGQTAEVGIARLRHYEDWMDKLKFNIVPTLRSSLATARTALDTVKDHGPSIHACLVFGRVVTFVPIARHHIIMVALARFVVLES